MKPLASTKDLAIDGGAPAFSEPLHVGRPNIGDPARFQRLVESVFERGWLTNNGPLVVELENRIADVLQVPHCVVTCNGTLALELAIRALELDGEAILPAYTFVATAHALRACGVKPVFADIDPATHNLDPAAVRSRITPETSGILGVHLWGRPAPVDALTEIADEHGLTLMFDAAHAFGCSHQGTMVGRFGSAEVLSFHATKVFNTFEGGAVLTRDAGLADRMRLMRNFGFAGYDDVVSWGTNGKMSEVCAAMGLVNLDFLDEVVAVNRRNYRAYREALAQIAGLEVLEYDERELNNYQYVVAEVMPDCALSRDDIVDALHAENVLVRKYFWPGCHRMQPYASQRSGLSDTLPQTDAVAARVVVFPTGTAVDEEAIALIGGILARLAERG